MLKGCLALLAVLLLAGPAHAKEAAPRVADQDTEARVARLSEKLRCLVCQNQTLADSNAPLANDLRVQVREQVKAGRSDDQIVEYLVQRYGDFVLYDPPFKATTLLLWIGPFALLAIGLTVLLRRVAAVRRRSAPGALDARARQTVAQVLDGDADEGGAR